MIQRVHWTRILIAVLCVAGTGGLNAAVLRGLERVDGRRDAPPPGTPIGAVNLLADAKLWARPENYCNRLSVLLSDGALKISKKADETNIDTAWTAATVPMPLTMRGLGYVLDFTVLSNFKLTQSKGGDRHNCAVDWFDHTGKLIESDPFVLRTPGESVAKRVVLLGNFPLAAQKVSVRFGFDQPDIHGEECLVFKNVTLTVLPRETDPEWNALPAAVDPRVEVITTTPFDNPKAIVKIRLSSPRKIDLSTVAIALDGQDATALFAHEGPVYEYRPSDGWEPGLHRIDLSFEDPETGERRTAKKVIFYGKPPSTPKVALRSDGVMLVDKKPFFPIGLFDVRKREFNGMSYDKAFADLKMAGVNLVHNYPEPRGEEFLKAADRYGMKAFVEMYKVDEDTVRRVRNHPSVIAWYVGDDTAMHDSPFEVYDRVDGVRAVDPTRITCQADVMNSGDAISSFRPFAKVTDVFQPEIYPISEVEPNPNPKCVALAIRDVERFKKDITEAGDTRPHAIWPLIQYFKGWSAWKRFPTRDELYAMSFGVLAHGAQGITWYTYGGLQIPERKAWNYGVTSSPEVWNNFTNLTARIAEIAPFLTEPATLQPRSVRILSGPETDALGQPSLSLLLRRRGCSALILAVNSTDKPMEVEFDPLADASQAEVLWEGRTVVVEKNRLRDKLAPFGVHAYKFVRPDVTYVAHQGEEGLAPNHSKAAYACAVRDGLDYLKLDVRRTKDNEIVLQHDDTFKAVMNWDVRIRDVTLAEILEKGRCLPKGGYTNETAVTLKEALVYGRQMKRGIWIDFKDYSPELAERVFSECAAAGIGPDRMMVATWNWTALKYVAEKHPEIRRVAHTFIGKAKDGKGFVTNNGEQNKVYPDEKSIVAELLRQRRELGLYGFNLPHVARQGKTLYHTSERVLRAVKRDGAWISIWFIDEEYTGEKYRSWGADNFVTCWAERTKRGFADDPEKAKTICWEEVGPDW